MPVTLYELNKRAIGSRRTLYGAVVELEDDQLGPIVHWDHDNLRVAGAGATDALSETEAVAVAVRENVWFPLILDIVEVRVKCAKPADSWQGRAF